MKEQAQNTLDLTNEEEIGSLPEKKIQNNDSKDDPKSWNRMEKIQEMFSNDLEELKSKQTMMNNTIKEI